MKKKYKHPVFLLLISMLIGFIGVMFGKDHTVGKVLSGVSLIVWIAAFIQYWRS